MLLTPCGADALHAHAGSGGTAEIAWALCGFAATMDEDDDPDASCAALCGALTDLGSAVSALVSLLNQNHVAERLSGPSRAGYAALMERVGHAATMASDMVERSRGLEDAAFDEPAYPIHPVRQ